MITLTFGQTLIVILCVCVIGYACGRIQRIVEEAVAERRKEQRKK